MKFAKTITSGLLLAILLAISTEFCGQESKESLEDLVKNFGTHKTKNYKIHYECDKAFAVQAGNALETLKEAFYKEFEKLEPKLIEKPMDVVILKNRTSFNKFAEKISPGSFQSDGFYSMEKDALVLYERKSKFLRTETILHEGTHQLTRRSKIHTFHIDSSLWVMEGLAVYFENPDGLKGKKIIIGKISNGRLFDLKLGMLKEDYLHLEKLVGLGIDDSLFKNYKTKDKVRVIYGEFWGLTHFFLNFEEEKYKEKFFEFIKEERKGYKKKEDNNKVSRVKLFKKIFGDDLKKLEDEWLKFVKDLKFTEEKWRKKYKREKEKIKKEKKKK